MQLPVTQEQTVYASLGWRAAAVLVDTLILFGLLILGVVVYVLVLIAQGSLDINDPSAIQRFSANTKVSDWVANVIVLGGLFIYYVVLEAAFGASVGKLAFRMRVTMVDGSRPTGGAVVLRNLVRIPEIWLLYAPAGISCLVSERKQRLGDHAAKTVVVRRASTVVGAGQATTIPGTKSPPAPPWPAAPHVGGPPLTVQPPSPVAATPPPSSPPGWPSVDEAVNALRTAALAVRGAHANYQHFSERELAAAQATPTADATAAAPEEPQIVQAYSPAYVTAWYALADAVLTLQRSHAALTTAATQADQTFAAACADHPDLVHLLGELDPYLVARSDEQVHAAYLQVARAASA